MFGSSGIQSSWGNPQQNQQQQQQQQQQQPQPQPQSVFGQPNAFGSGAFGTSGSAFGQPQPQQQTNPMFGTTPQNTGGGFGAFGGGTTTNNASGSLFGGAKPATGFGAFGGGGTSAFGGNTGGAFGSTSNNQSSAFGQPSTSTGSAFGNTGGGLFGSKPAGTAFGGTPSNPAAGPYDGTAPVTTGTSNPPYSVFSEKDPANASVTLQYQTITCMPQYRGTSLEELRFQDYQQNRKTASVGGAFGQPSAFGSTQPSTGTGLFGQPAQSQQTTTPAFGGFGSTTQNTSTNTGGLFGQATSNQAPGGAFGSFGQQQPQQQQPQTTSAFGAFGQPQPQQQPQQQQQSSGGLFGGNNAFGNTQNKPFGSAFGGNTGFGTTGTTGGGLFGQSNTSNQPQQSSGTGLFGQAPQNAGGNAFGGGAFGANNNAPKPLFGQPQQSTGFGAPGGQQNQQNPPQNQTGGGLFGGGSLFGQNTQQQNQPNTTQTGGLFGNTQAGQSQPTGGLFGGGGGGLFGNTNQQQQQQQQQSNQQQPQNTVFGGFGAKPNPPATGGGLFGSTNIFGQQNTNAANQGAQNQPAGLFGNLGQSTNQPSIGAFGGGLFGSKPAAPATSLQPTSQPLGGSVFGNTLNTSALGSSTAGAGTLQASIAQPVTANLPIFSMLPSAPPTAALDQSMKKKSSLFEAPIRAPTAQAIGFQPSSQKLRGYASTLRASTPNGSNIGLSLTSGRPNILTFSTTMGKNSSDAFGSSAQLGSAPKSSVKKLILDKKVDATELLRRSSASPSPGKPTFNPALSVAAREREASTAPPVQFTTAIPPSRNQRLIGQSPHKEAEATSLKELQEGDYWSEPSILVLSKLGYEDLAQVKNLAIGRVGFGQIEFLEPVDLTTLAKLSDLLGDQVRFDKMECSVYPDSDDIDKPPPGSGLNVRARITLLRCWPLDKATRQPIKDGLHPQVVKHMKRLKTMKDTTFESFDLEEGKWTFVVEHF